MTAISRTLSASVPPPANLGSSSPIRGLSAELLQSPANEVLGSITKPSPIELDDTSASEFFSLFETD